MRGRIVVGSLAALLVPAAAAAGQGDPVMPLSEVQPGMKCTGLTVVRGTGIDSFDVEVLDVVGADEGARILVRVSGPAVDATGIGAGFSGSPVYCPGADGRAKNAGAISETIGEFGGKTVLATPIEAILGTSPDPPAEDRAAPARAFAGGRPLTGPLTVRGLHRRVYLALAQAARRNGRIILQAPPAPVSSPAPQPLRPGSAVSIGVSSGDVALGAVGTVAYVDGEKVWALGHPFDGVGRRSLFLQDAYVATVIGNPVQLPEGGGTYKLAGAVNDLGTVSNDGFSAVAGRVGALPPAVPVRIFAHDEDTGRETTTEVSVADETDAGSPTGTSPLSFLAPLAVAQAATQVLGSAPTRLSGDMCLRLTLRERPKPLRICNRYVADGTGEAPPAAVGNAVALRAASDVSEVINLIDSYRVTGLHVTEVAARIKLRRGQRQAFMRRVRLPRRVRPGERVPVALTVQRIRGPRETIRFKLRLPTSVAPGERRLVFRGTEADGGDEDLFGSLTITLGEPEAEEDAAGPTTLAELVSEIRKIQRYDGIRLGSRGGRRAYRDPRLRIGGRAEATVLVTGR